MTNNIALYFHIPFCVKKCDYCAFYSLAGENDRIKQAYFEALMRQLDFFVTDKEVSSVYFGGGTPPMLGTERLCSLIRAVCSGFTLAENCEITVEVNPGTVDFDALYALKMSGANRLSVGIQAADDAVLRSIGRIHTFEESKKCIGYAKAAGFDSISADIIFALPFQSEARFADGVRKIAATGVNHISAYSLQIEEGTPIYEKRSELVFPDEEREEAQYGMLCDILKQNGFEHYEISSFSKKGAESRHNLNYWACGEYFGFGAGAHSFYGGKRFSARADIEYFIEKSRVSLLAPTDFDECEPITAEEAEAERIMLGLRTSAGAVIPESAYGAAERIAKLGYGRLENGRFALNSKGFRVSNSIIAQILT